MKKHITLNYVSLFLAALFFLFATESCTITKRVHRPGFRVEWKNKQGTTKTAKKDEIPQRTLNAADDRPIEKSIYEGIAELKQEENATSEEVILNEEVESVFQDSPEMEENKSMITVEKSVETPTSEKPSRKLTPRKIALITGISLLLMAIVAGFAAGTINGFFVSGNAAQTASNVMSAGRKLNGAIAGWVLIFLLDLIVSGGVHKYYKERKPKLALLTGILRVIYTVILGVAIAQLFKVNPAGSGAGIYKHLDAFHHIWGIGLIVFGLHLIALGILYKAEGGKKWWNITLKALLTLAGIGYVAQYVGMLLVPNPATFAATMESIFILPMILGEVAFAIWMIVKGGKTTK